MKKIVKNLLFFTFVLIAVLVVKKLCKHATDGFTISKISSSLTPSSTREIPSLTVQETKDLQAILDQEFVYLNKGAQCYVFASQDGKYVVKFFKIPFLPPTFIKKLPLPSSFSSWMERKTWKKEATLFEEFTSYKIAYEDLKEETGIVYLHLNKTSCFQKKLCIVDKLGIKHLVDIDSFEFIVQKKGTLVYPYLNTLMKEHKIEESKKCIQDLFHLILHRAQKGILDTDPNLSKNFAFLDHVPIQIDVGRFLHVTPKQIEEIPLHERNRYLHRMGDDFRNWLFDHHPELVETFDIEYAKLLQSKAF